MKNYLLLVIIFSFLQISAQTLNSSLDTNGRFVSGLNGVNNFIYVTDLFGDETSATLFILDENGNEVYSEKDVTAANGFEWQIDMGNLYPGDYLIVEFETPSGNFLSNDIGFPEMIAIPHWLEAGTVENVVLDENNTTISFTGNYPIFELQKIIDPNIKGLGNKPLGLVGKFQFNAVYNYLSNIAPVVSDVKAKLNINVINQKDINENLDLSGNPCTLDNNFNIAIIAEQYIETPELSFYTPKFKFPLGATGIKVSIDAGMSLYATLSGKIVIGQNNGNWGFADLNGEKTNINGILNGKAFIRGEMSALAGAVKITGSIKGTARLGIGFEYQNIPSVSVNELYGGDIRLYGSACYKTFWGVGPSKCIESDDWYYGSFGNLDVFNKKLSSSSNFDLPSITFKDTGTLILPNFHPQPSFGTRGDLLYTVWLEHDDNIGYLMFTGLNNATNTFQDEKIIVSNTNSISNPKVAIMPSGSAIITWTQNRYNDLTLPVGASEIDIVQAQDIWYAIYDKQSDSIILLKKLDDNETNLQSGRAEGEALVTVNNNNEAMITWVVTNSIASSSDIYFSKIKENNNNWVITSPTILSDLNGINSNVNVVYTDNSSILSVWINDPDSDEDTYNSNLIYSEWTNNTWSTAQTLAFNDGNTKLNDLSIASNEGFVSFAWTSSHFDANNQFENRIDLMVYDAVLQDWDLQSIFSDTDSNFYFQLPNTSISKEGKAIVCYQAIGMFADSNYIPNGSINLFAKDLMTNNNWIDITENAFIGDTSTFIWDLSAGFSENNNYYIITQEYNDNGIVTNPLNGVKFGDPDLSLVLRGVRFNQNNTISDIAEPNNVSLGLPKKDENFKHSRFELFPNPAGQTTILEYQVDINSNIQIELIDIYGNKLIISETDGVNPGIYKTIFDTQTLTNGVYTCRLTINGVTESRKLIIIH